MAKSWYPGHMVKAMGAIEDILKLIDVVIEVVDARAPKTSRNKDLARLTKNKPRVVALNKYDISDKEISLKWREHYHSDMQKAVFCNAVSGEGVNSVISAAASLAKETNARLTGVRNKKYRALIVGLPNVGKSSFINRAANKVKAKVGDKPGVTRNNQWIQINTSLEMLDTPGIMPARVDEISEWFVLCSLGLISDKLIDQYSLSLALISYLKDMYPRILCDRYSIDPLIVEPHEILRAIGIRRGCVRQKGEVEIEKAADILLRDYRQGAICGVSMQSPDAPMNYEKYLLPYFSDVELNSVTKE